MSKAVIKESKHSSKIIKEIPTANLRKIVLDQNHKTRLSSVIPFRVRFTNIGIEGYGPGNPAPIGIAVIGFNNYIL